MSGPKAWWQRFKELYRARHEPEYLRPLAEMTWRGILMLTLIGGIVVIFYGATEFWDVLDHLSAGPSNTAPPQQGFDRNKLESALQSIRSRQQAFDSLKNSPEPIADPSK